MVAYGVASVLQSVGAHRAAAPGTGFVRALAHQLPYLAGVGLDMVGFAASVVALRGLPLFFVQSAVAGSVGVTAAVSARYLGARLSRPEQLALVVLVVGLVLLAASARPEAPTPLPEAARWTLLAGVALMAVAGAASARRGGAVLLGLLAGLGFSGVGIAARSWRLPSDPAAVLADPTVWAVIGYGVIGALLFAAALQRGRVTATAAVTFAAETCLPTAVGVAFLGDRPRTGLMPLAVVGFCCALGASVALARHAEATA